MVINQKIVDPFNAQIRNEFTNMFGYLAISSYFDDQGLVDLSAFFAAQAEDERLHAMKFFTFLQDAGARPLMLPLPQVNNDFKSAEHAVEFALQQEVKTTNQIHDLASLSLDESDHSAYNFLQWFITEQVEEVDTMTKLLQTVKLANGNLLRVEEYVRRNMPAVGTAADAAAA